MGVLSLDDEPRSRPPISQQKALSETWPVIAGRTEDGTDDDDVISDDDVVVKSKAGREIPPLST